MRGGYSFKVDWKNPEFRTIIRKMITPKESLSLIVPSPDRINIALHVREGGGFDAASTRLTHASKLPPLTFYKEGLAKIVSLFPDKEIFCHLFTDARHPKKLIELLKDALPPKSSVQFSYRKKHNGHDKNVLEDFFSLFNFDILIRPQSNFSIVPSLIHDYAIVYSPIEVSIVGDCVTIDKTNLEINEELYQKLLSRDTHSSSFFFSW